MADIIVQPFAASGDKTIPPQNDPNGFVNFQLGYPTNYELIIGVDANAHAVERQVFNYIMFMLTQNVQSWQQFGFAEWYSTMPGGYSVSAYVRRFNGTHWFIWRSLVDNNSVDPLTTNQTSWELVPFNSQVIANIPMPTGGSGGSTTEIVTVATDFNSFGTGTWEFLTSAIAQASPHSPVPSGGSTLAGMLESKAWVNGGTSYATQRYSDYGGNAFFRGALNGTWSGWTNINPFNNYGIDTSVSANTVQCSIPITSTTVPDNAQFWVKIANTNTGATNFTPNLALIPAGLPVLGEGGIALQGNELVAGCRALLVYKADTNNYFIVACVGTGVSSQVGAATQTFHIPQMLQLQAYTDVYSVDSGTVNAVVGNATTLLNGVVRSNQQFWVKITNANTGATTFKPTPTAPAFPVINNAYATLTGGELVVGGRALFIFKEDTNQYILAANEGAQVNNNFFYANAAATLVQGKWMIDSSGGPFNLTLPSVVFKGLSIELIDCSFTWWKNPVTLLHNGNNIMGFPQDHVLNISDRRLIIWFNGTEWRLI